MISRRRNNNSLDAALRYRNGQVDISTPQKAFDIYKKTASLDLMKANEENPTFQRAIQGYNALYGNKTGPETFNGLTEKDI